MNTFLSASQQTDRDNYLSFAEKEIKPRALLLESKAPAEKGSTALKEVLQIMGQSGYLGLTVPKEYGGQGAPFLNLILFVEAISQHEPGLALALAHHIAAIELIKKFGTDNQKARYLPDLSRGELIATVAVSEENAGTDYRAIQCTYKASGDTLNLTGKKVMVANADTAGLALVFAKSSDNPEKTALIMADIDPARQSQTDSSVKVFADPGKLGLKSCSTNALEFNNHQVAANCLLGENANADELVLYSFDIAQVVLAAAALGVAQGSLAEALAHAKSRQQFGQNIGQFQPVQFKIADLSTESQAARLQTYRAAWAKDESAKEFRNFSAMSKWLAAKVARFHTGEAMQIMGSQGISAESKISRFYRDAKVMEILVGTSEFQKMRIVEELDI